MFPSNDLSWLEVTQFIKAHRSVTDKIVAPSEFQQEIGYCIDLFEINLDVDFQWFVIHKGWVDRVPIETLELVLARMHPVYANPVFVIFAERSNLPVINWQDLHLASLVEKIGIRRNSNSEFSLQNLNECMNTIVKKLQSLETSSKDDNIFANIREIVDIERDVVQLICRSACQNSYLGNDTALCRVLTNYFCYVDTTDICLSPHLLLNGYWEIWITKLLAKIVLPGWNCVDVGANCGYYTLLMGDLVGRSGRILAIEPQPKLSNLVVKSLQLNGLKDRATVSNRAAADKSGESVRLYVPTGFLGDAKILSSTQLEPQATSECLTVETVTIDELVIAWDRVNFVKIDAEGAERAIWQGMQQTLQSNPKLTILLEFSNYRLNYYDPREFLTEIVDAGFALNSIDGDSQLVPMTFDECLANQDEFIDLVLIR